MATERESPAAIKPNLKSIEVPGAIRTLPAWLIWRYEQHDGEKKPRKVPYYTSGGKRHGVQGRPEDRASLTTFDAAKAAAARRGFDGVGFALMPEWGVTALDFDNCFGAEGLHPVVEKLIADTYAEYSPSGTGVRALVKGDLGNHKSPTDGAFAFETFSTKGFVTFTGNRLEITELLGNENAIADISKSLAELCQRRFGEVFYEQLSTDSERLQMRQAEERWATLLPGMPSEVYARLSKVAWFELDTDEEIKLSIVRKHLPSSWEHPEEALRALRESEFADASFRLRQAFARDLAMSSMPSESSSTNPIGLRLSQAQEALDVLDPNSPRLPWLQVGMALHHEYGGSDEAFELWNDWSAKGETYPGRNDLLTQWASLGKRKAGKQITARSLIKSAQANGAYIGLNAPSVDDFEVISETSNLLALKDADGKELTLARDRQGRFLATIENVAKAVRAATLSCVQVGFDSFRDEVMIGDKEGRQWQPFTDADYTRLRIRLERGGFKPIGREMIRDVIGMLAEDYRFDSAVTWLEGLEWDGVPRIEGFLSRYFGVEDTAYNKAVSRYLWTALAGRVMAPGCQADMAVVLVGSQGIGKSTAVAAIAPHRDQFVEMTLDAYDVELARKMRGKLVAEIGELRGLASRDEESIKSFISRTHEEWTPKYKEFSIKFPRRLVFIGTTNREEFLADDSGNRRWLPVKVTRADRESLVRDRLQLWAEARDTFALIGVDFNDAERLATEVHRDHMLSDAWESSVEQWLSNPSGIEFSVQGPADGEPFPLRDVLVGALNLDIRTVNRLTELRVGRILRGLGYEKGVFRNGKQLQKLWSRKK